MKENYEVVIVFDSKMNETEIDKVIEKINATIKSSAGEIIKLEKQGRKKFSYEIRGREAGNFVFMDIILAKDKVETLEKNCGLTDSILRYLIVRKSKHENQATVIEQSITGGR